MPLHSGTVHLSRRKIIAPLTFEGYRAFLMPSLSNFFLQPGQTVILDNAAFHKSKKISELAKGVGAEILYLPPYSPDFNEIEHQWFAIKNRARKNIPIFKFFRLAVDSAFL